MGLAVAAERSFTTSPPSPNAVVTSGTAAVARLLLMGQRRGSDGSVPSWIKAEPGRAVPLWIASGDLGPPAEPTQRMDLLVQRDLAQQQSVGGSPYLRGMWATPCSHISST